VGRVFEPDTKKLVADLSANICNNPRCQKLCAGPSNAQNVDRKYIGEVAHIVDKATTRSAQTTIRFVENYPDDLCRNADNAIFLCPTCHKNIDKNNGSGYTAERLREWRQAHYELIHECLVNEYSLAGQLKASSALAATFDPLMAKLHNMAALIDDPALESWKGVVESFWELRDIAGSLLLQGSLSKDEAATLKGLQTVAMVIRREIPLDDQGQLSGTDLEAAKATLLLARRQVGTELQQLSKLSGCQIPDSVKHIIPALPFRGLK
jgi:hypothetical protein